MEKSLESVEYDDESPLWKTAEERDCVFAEINEFCKDRGFEFHEFDENWEIRVKRISTFSIKQVKAWNNR